MSVIARTLRGSSQRHLHVEAVQVSNPLIGARNDGVYRNGEFMISETLIEILRCPNCVRTTGGLLKLHQDTWFICQECARKYPIVDDIPVMLIDEGDKWVNVAEADLPVPPPAK